VEHDNPGRLVGLEIVVPSWKRYSANLEIERHADLDTLRPGGSGDEQEAPAGHDDGRVLDE
jgi:hypothetical protein